MTAHFLDRCRDRGLAHCAEDLLRDMHQALAWLRKDDPRAHGFIEHVFTLPTHGRGERKEIYRIFVAEVQYFVVVADRAIPMTILTRDMIAYYRERSKAPKKRRGPRIRKINGDR